VDALSIDAQATPPEAGARDGLSSPQKLLLLAAVLVAVLVAATASAPLTWFMLVASALFLLVISVMLGAAIESWTGAPPDQDLLVRASLERRDWPSYSILVPLYREAAVARQLLEAMARLDYPPERLEILFLVESDDAETAAALGSDLPGHGRVVVVPEGVPRTKPRALNHGFARASGEYVTVFDAEDIPEPDQLKRAVLLFESAPRRVQCVQGRLCIDNLADGWLPLMEAIEYMALFDSLKCGLSLASMPVPLGGTSNHFRRSDLTALGGWDAWNVAEDADLGLRIARRGGIVLDLASTTYEEAPIQFGGWLRQRRRWFKGWLQTAAVNARKPRAAIARMGMTAWLVSQIGVLGLVLSALCYPFFSAWIAWNFHTGDLFDAETPLAFAANSVALAVAATGGLTMAAPALIGLRRRRLWHLAPWLVTLPLYLFLVSFAAWLALWDLNRRPFHWGKTEHGLGWRNLERIRSRR
jgi:cellulose synthase/poly-beta-1,6-N-acetylglucosamine synthase-like glycosyltransferase